MEKLNEFYYLMKMLNNKSDSRFLLDDFVHVKPNDISIDDIDSFVKKSNEYIISVGSGTGKIETICLFIIVY